ncbi:MAG: hypothetical protein MPW15_13795 [Candidatus Manganitrophus sp.]|nr:hypothetical protein [Candidatus Manganitrophus sp.]
MHRRPNGVHAGCSARIHRLTLDRLRRQIEPASVETFLQFLLQWHRLLPKTQLHGREGLFSVIEQLQGFEIAASAWERIILPSRIARYNPVWLDELCLNGEVAWGRLSPPVAKKSNGDEPGRPRQATRNLPISLMAREDLGWLRAPSEETPFLSENAKTVLDALRRQGASFVSDLLTATRLLPAQIDEALWELVAAGSGNRGWVLGNSIADRSESGGAGRPLSTAARMEADAPRARKRPMDPSSPDPENRKRATGFGGASAGCGGSGGPFSFFAAEAPI